VSTDTQVVVEAGTEDVVDGGVDDMVVMGTETVKDIDPVEHIEVV